MNAGGEVQPSLCQVDLKTWRKKERQKESEKCSWVNPEHHSYTTWGMSVDMNCTEEKLEQPSLLWTAFLFPFWKAPARNIHFYLRRLFFCSIPDWFTWSWIMMETLTDVLLVTANVGSLFDNVSMQESQLMSCFMVVNGSLWDKDTQHGAFHCCDWKRKVDILKISMIAPSITQRC